MGQDMMGGWGWSGGGLIGMFFILIFWILIIIGIIFIVKWIIDQSNNNQNVSQNTPTSKTETPALEILKARYARGEIDKKEFEEKKKDLS